VRGRPTYQFYLGRFFFLGGQLERARAVYETYFAQGGEAEQISRIYSIAHVDYGVVLARLGDSDAARSEMTWLEQNERRYSAADYQLGRAAIAVALREHDLAIEILRHYEGDPYNLSCGANHWLSPHKGERVFQELIRPKG
jgi:hypothetical protein